MTQHSYRGMYQYTPEPREDLIEIMEAGLAAEEVREPQKKTFEERAWFNGFPAERI